MDAQTTNDNNTCFSTKKLKVLKAHFNKIKALPCVHVIHALHKVHIP